MSTQLTVYKASAGSGKTFTLACEYMALVIDNPQSYRTILAVTFTNKATEEMKMRILSQLYGIAHELADSRGYLEQIKKALPHLSHAQIVKNAGTALGLLLHNYNYFRVETIDTFFQSVLRNLARELDLTANLRIDLNASQVEQRAVDELIEGLDTNPKLLQWIISYIEEMLADDKSWNVIESIKSFGSNIFSDIYKEHAQRLNLCLEDDEFFSVFTKELRRMERSIRKKYMDEGKDFFDTIEKSGLSIADFSGKEKGICGYFIRLKNDLFDDSKIVNKSLEKALQSDDAWVTKPNAKPGKPAYDLVVSTLRRQLCRIEGERPHDQLLCNSARLTLTHINELRLLGSIDKAVRRMNSEANRFLLCDTQSLLHSLIQDSDSPFIFEKIGTQLEHVMIDEFQDTSVVQWQNFKVLLRETLSRQSSGNLLVGDVKQSIYRWRSGDWRLLNNIENQFGAERTDIRTLDTNYRSDRNVVDFNNAFFANAAQIEYDMLKEDLPEDSHQLLTAYADVCQKVPESKAPRGYVNIRLIHSGKEDGTADERTFQAVKDIIDQLRAEGAQYSQIAILVRRKNDIQQLADWLMEHGDDYKLVSDEAFRLDASQAVMAMVTALRLLSHPDDNISMAALRRYAETYLSDDTLVDSLVADRSKLLQQPLLDLAEQLFIRLQLAENEEMQRQSAYVCSFFDCLSSFVCDNGSDIEEFLKLWDDDLHSTSIQSDTADGIRLLTIHKSKGLEFDHVIMPFCDWTLEYRETLIWGTADEEPFSALPLVPLKFEAKLKDSVYGKDYLFEKFQNRVDNLNLLYVGFTRASHSLFVIGKREGDSHRSATIEKVLPEVANLLSDTGEYVHLEGDGSDKKTDDVCLEYGQLTVEKKVKEEPRETANVFLQHALTVGVTLHGAETLPVFKQSNKSRDFIQGDEDEEQQKHYIRMGTVLHQLFSTIRTTADIDSALQQLELDGLLYDENVSREKIVGMIRKRLESNCVADWFSDRWTLYNECSILSIEDDKVVEHRPDRVMKDGEKTIVVDFKFGKPKSEHQQQVRQYMDLLAGMDTHAQIEGYLWYVYPNKVVEVS